LLEWHHLPTNFHKNLPICSKDIHRSLIPEASNAFRPFLHYSKIQALVTIVTSAKVSVWCNRGNPTVNIPNPLLSKAHLTNLNLNHFKMVEAMGLKLLN
jgi:hypothetical protein